MAKHANVSVATVSRVVNGGKAVSDATNQSVYAALKELGYMAASSARNLGPGVQSDERTIALILPDVDNPFFSNVLAHMQREFMQYGYFVLPVCTRYDPALEQQFFDLLEQVDCAGLIVISSLSDRELSVRVRNQRRPVTLMDRMLDNFVGNVVIQDNFQAGYIAAKHLIDLGYEHIRFVAGHPNSFSAMQRVNGFTQALYSHFMPVSQDMITYGGLDLRRGVEEARQYLRGDLAADAWVIGNDMTAIGFIEALRQEKIDPISEFSIVSFDDIEMSALFSFQLTTVHQPIEDMCRLVAQEMVASVKNPKATECKRIALKPTLVVRGTTHPKRPIGGE